MKKLLIVSITAVLTVMSSGCASLSLFESVHYHDTEESKEKIANLEKKVCDLEKKVQNLEQK